MNKYIKKRAGGYKLTEEFYKLSLADKYMIIESPDFKQYIPDVPDVGWQMNPALEKLRDAVVLAILQHSDEQDKEDYPVNGERKLHADAKKSDERESYQALFVNFDKVFSILQRQGLVRGVFDK